MGKKRSVALIVLITIVLAGVLFMSITPTFYVSEVKKFNSLLSIVDLGRDLGDGYYTVYYPEGVISDDEYEDLKAEYEYGQEEGTSDLSDPAGDYTAYRGIYISNDLMEDGKPGEAFRNNFAEAYKAVKARYEGMGFSDYTVRLQDDYTIRAEIPALDNDEYDAEAIAQNIFTLFSYSGELLFTDASDASSAGTAEMEGSADNIRSATTENAGEQGYAVAINFTSAGQEAFRELTSSLTSSGSSTTLNIFLGENVLLSASVSGTMDQSSVYITGGYTAESAKAVATLINSVIDGAGAFELSFAAPEYFAMEPSMGVHTALIAAVCIGVLALASLVYFLVRFKGMGLAHLYGFITYALAVILCISLIPAVQLTIGGLCAIVLASAFMCYCNYYAFNNIKKEFSTGKTLTASVKSGYKNSLAFTIDAHAILLIAGLALYLIATGGVKFMALIFTLAVAASAVCTLLLTRFYLYMFMAQPKNERGRIAFVGFKREETEDD